MFQNIRHNHHGIRRIDCRQIRQSFFQIGFHKGRSGQIAGDDVPIGAEINRYDMATLRQIPQFQSIAAADVHNGAYPAPFSEIGGELIDIRLIEQIARRIQIVCRRQVGPISLFYTKILWFCHV